MYRVLLFVVSEEAREKGKVIYPSSISLQEYEQICQTQLNQTRKECKISKAMEVFDCKREMATEIVQVLEQGLTISYNWNQWNGSV